MKIPTPIEESYDERPERSEPDGLLLMLTMLVNGSDTELSLTLNVGGATVTGTLCSAMTYFKGLADELDQRSSDAPVGDGLKSLFIDIADKMAAEMPSAPVGDDEVDPADFLQPTEFIHLKNARILSGGTTIPTFGGAWWRGLLESVDGFILGSFEHAPASGATRAT